MKLRENSKLLSFSNENAKQELYCGFLLFTPLSVLVNRKIIHIVKERASQLRN